MTSSTRVHLHSQPLRKEGALLELPGHSAEEAVEGFHAASGPLRRRVDHDQADLICADIALFAPSTRFAAL
jgi:hypothetical protein